MARFRRRLRKGRLIAFILIIVLLFLLVCVAIIAFDIAYHRLGRDFWNKGGSNRMRQFDSTLGWAPIPEISNQHYESKISPYTFSTNSLGLRGSEEIDPKKSHILVVGDSVTWGHGVDDQNTSSGFLEALLKEDGQDFQVLNLGVVGYGIDQYYIRLGEIINQTSPELVVVNLYVGNDISETSSDVCHGKDKPLFVLVDGELVNVKPISYRNSCNNLFSDSWIIWKGILGAGEVRNSVCGGRDNEEEGNKEVIVALLGALNRTAAEHGAKLLFTILPGPWDAENESEDLRFFRSVLEKGGYDHIDENEIFLASGAGAGELYLPNDSHFTAYGNRLVAESIFEHIRKQGSGKQDSKIRT